MNGFRKVLCSVKTFLQKKKKRDVILSTFKIWFGLRTSQHSPVVLLLNFTNKYLPAFFIFVARSRIISMAHMLEAYLKTMTEGKSLAVSRSSVHSCLFFFFFHFFCNEDYLIDLALHVCCFCFSPVVVKSTGSF